MTRPFFSIITPIYNGSAYLSPYVSSLLAQHFQDWEAIVVDDGSSDGSLEIAESLIQGDKRFRLYKPCPSSQSLPVAGPYYPRNIALSMVRGKYVCFYDVDDLWLPCKLMEQYRVLLSNPNIQLLFSNYYKVDASLSRGYCKPRFDFLGFKTQVLLWNPIPNLTSCLAADLATSVKFEPVRHEDYIYWFNVIGALKQSNILKLNKALALYRCTPGSLSSNKLRVISWWISCYKLIGHPLILRYLLLSFKIFSEGIEIFLVKTGFIRTISVPPSLHDVKTL